LNVITKNVGTLLAKKNLVEKEVRIEKDVAVRETRIESEQSLEREPHVCAQMDSTITEQRNVQENNLVISEDNVKTFEVPNVSLLACISYYQSVELVSTIFDGLKEAVEGKKNEEKFEKNRPEKKNIKSCETGRESVERKSQEESKIDNQLLLNEIINEESSITEESVIVNASKKDTLPSPHFSHVKNNKDFEEHSLFELIYSLHKYFDHTELDEVIQRLADSTACGESNQNPEKAAPKDSSDSSGSDYNTGELSSSPSDSDGAVLLEDLNRSPRVLVYEENRVNFIDECFDTLDGVEYCTAVVNTACNPCASTINVVEDLEAAAEDATKTEDFDTIGEGKTKSKEFDTSGEGMTKIEQ